MALASLGPGPATWHFWASSRRGPQRSASRRRFEFDYTLSGSARILDPDSLPTPARPGVRIAIVGNHASTMALRRIVKAASLVENELPDQAFAVLRAGKADAFALPREVLEDYAAALPGPRVLTDRYGFNRVGIAVGKDRAGLLACVSEFVEEAKSSGRIQRIFDRGGLHSFRVPPQNN